MPLDRPGEPHPTLRFGDAAIDVRTRTLVMATVPLRGPDDAAQLTTRAHDAVASGADVVRVDAPPEGAPPWFVDNVGACAAGGRTLVAVGVSAHDVGWVAALRRRGELGCALIVPERRLARSLVELDVDPSSIVLDAHGLRAVEEAVRCTGHVVHLAGTGDRAEQLAVIALGVFFGARLISGDDVAGAARVCRTVEWVVAEVLR
jgi:hypothetical protein